jgi:hypothetical protein
MSKTMHEIYLEPKDGSPVRLVLGATCISRCHGRQYVNKFKFRLYRVFKQACCLESDRRGLEHIDIYIKF